MANKAVEQQNFELEWRKAAAVAMNNYNRAMVSYSNSCLNYQMNVANLVLLLV